MVCVVLVEIVPFLVALALHDVVVGGLTVFRTLLEGGVGPAGVRVVGMAERAVARVVRVRLGTTGAVVDEVLVAFVAAFRVGRLHDVIIRGLAVV